MSMVVYGSSFKYLVVSAAKVRVEGWRKEGYKGKRAFYASKALHLFIVSNSGVAAHGSQQINCTLG